MALARKMAKKESDPWSLEERVRKRRKLDSEVQGQSSTKGKDDWDDSMELTQAELETLDVIASQAIVEDASDLIKVAKKRVKTAVDSEADDLLFFAKPSLKPHEFTRRSTSSSSGSTAHPASLSSRSASDASGSLSSNTSENGRADGDTVRNLRLKLEEEIKKAQEEKYRSAGEMAFLRESLRNQEDELERVRADRDAAMEKEKLIQRDSAKMLQLQLDSMASEAQFKEQEFKTLQEQYTSLQQKLKRLEQEKHYQSPSGSAAEISSVWMSSPKKVPVRPSPPSKQKLKRMEEAGAQRKGFPATQTFLEQAPSSPRGSPTKASVSNTGCQTTETSSVLAGKTRRLKLKLLPVCGKETVTGKDVVQHLLQTSPVRQTVGTSSTGDWDMGLMSLMHAMSSALNVASLSYHRTGGSASLSPIKPKRLTPKKGTREETSGALQVVSKEHYQLAVDGLSQLLDERLHVPGERMGSDGTDSRIKDVSDINKNFSSKAWEDLSTKPSSSLQTKPSAHSRAPPGPDWIASSAGLILPLLTDYIQHYVELLNFSPTKSGTGSGLMRSQHHPVSPYRSNLESTSHSATSSSSCESSLDSLNSSILQLLHDGHVYAASIERYTCAALRCITLLLLLCPAVGDFILVPQPLLNARANAFSSTSGNSSTAEGDGKSEVDADDEKSVSSCEIRILPALMKQASASSPDIRPRLQTPVLFHLVLQLAAQDLKDSSCAPEVMAQALYILSLLCQGSRDEHILKLQTIASRGILTNCLRHTSHVAVLVGAVRLLQSMLGQAALFSKICTKSENCPLFLMHQINASKDIHAKLEDMVVFYKEYISCLSSLIAVQEQGLQQLLSTSCPCSTELVPGIVLALYKLFKLYQQETKKTKLKQRSCSSVPAESQSAARSPRQEDSRGTLWTLGQGVTLLHAVAQADTAFLPHHSPVQPEYVCLLSGLRAVFRASACGWEFHLTALEELCDFDPDLSDLSQESESEGMDQG